MLSDKVVNYTVGGLCYESFFIEDIIMATNERVNTFLFG